MIESARDWLSGMWLVICLSFMAGLARAARCGERSLWGWGCSSIVALFAGVVTHMLINDLTGVSETVKIGCASISAYSGGTALDALQARLGTLADVALGITKPKHEGRNQ